MSKKKKIPWGIKTQFIFGNLLKLINPVWTFNQNKTTLRKIEIYRGISENGSGTKEILSYVVFTLVRAFSQDDLTNQPGKTFAFYAWQNMRLRIKRAVLLLLHSFNLKYSHEKPGWDIFSRQSQCAMFTFSIFFSWVVCLFVCKENLNFGTWEL